MHRKERPHPAEGTIPHALDMFRSEVRFYREIAPEVGVRVPACFTAEEHEDGFRLELEDLGDWEEGGDAVAVAEELAVLHGLWEGRAEHRWPWLRRVGAGADLIAVLYDRTWPEVERRGDVSAAVVELGRSFVGRVEELEAAEGAAGPLTLIHGDVSARNVRTGPDGEIAFVDWEDVRLACGAVDLAWWLVSSVEPVRWDEVVAASSSVDRDGLAVVLPTAASQAIFGLAGEAEGSEAARRWVRAIEAVAARLG